MFFGNAESKNFLYWRRRRKSSFLFYNFLCTFKTRRCFNFYCKVSWKIRFADKKLSFSVTKSLFLHLMLLSVAYAKSNTIFDFHTEAHTRDEHGSGLDQD